MNQNPSEIDKKKRVFLYLRCSTDKQTVESQLHSLTAYCEQNKIVNYEIFTDEGISGAKASRPSLNRMMEAVERDEALQVVVFSFSRFARSTTHLLQALQKFKEKNVRFISVTERIDTNSPMGVAMFTILSALSQMEREIIVQRVKAGLANARAKGKKIGRTKTRNSELIRALLKKNLSYRAIASIADCSHGSIYAEKMAWKKELEEKKKQEEEITKMESNDLVFRDPSEKTEEPVPPAPLPEAS